MEDLGKLLLEKKAAKEKAHRDKHIAVLNVMAKEIAKSCADGQDKIYFSNDPQIKRDALKMYGSYLTAWGQERNLHIKWEFETIGSVYVFISSINGEKRGTVESI